MTEPSKPPPLKLTQPPAEDLFSATEDVRASDYPDVSAELLAAVLRAERDNLDSRVAAARTVGREIDAWLASHPAAPTPTTTDVADAAADSSEGGQS